MSKKSYKVFQQVIQTYTDTGHVEKTDTYLGSTYAVSPKQAVNNVLYRKGIDRHNSCDGPCYHRVTNFYAKESIYG